LNEEKTREWISRNEGTRHKMYIDTEGYPTIGIGHRVRRHEMPLFKDREITDKEVQELFDYDFSVAVGDARRVVPFFDELSDNRQMVLVDMAFQMGRMGLAGFRRMIRAITKGDFVLAAAEILDSKYYLQTPGRARKNAELLLEG